MENKEILIKELQDENKELRRLLSKLKTCFNCDSFTSCSLRLEYRKECKSNNLIYWQEKVIKRGTMNV